MTNFILILSFYLYLYTNQHTTRRGVDDVPTESKRSRIICARRKQHESSPRRKTFMASHIIHSRNVFADAAHVKAALFMMSHSESFDVLTTYTHRWMSCMKYGFIREDDRMPRSRVDLGRKGSVKHQISLLPSSQSFLISRSMDIISRG